MENQFILLQSWLGKILSSIKKEIKAEHLAKSPVFYRSLFGNRPMNRITSEEILKAYEQELLKGNEELGEWIVNRWVFQHGEIYKYFAEHLAKINPNFDEIASLGEAETGLLIEGALPSFGALNTYAFCVLNRVVLAPSGFDRLRSLIETQERECKEAEEAKAQNESLEQTALRHEKELIRLRDKCEDRVAGVLKKYATDTEALKRQIRALQAKLNDLALQAR